MDVRIAPDLKFKIGEVIQDALRAEEKVLGGESTPPPQAEPDEPQDISYRSKVVCNRLERQSGVRHQR
jgi:hypothetical protein